MSHQQNDAMKIVFPKEIYQTIILHSFPQLDIEKDSLSKDKKPFGAGDGI